ncbi:MAG: hypothetical protein M9890_07845 [Thermomicrobiales bacterium]|nr:hypothetical protein [Thermomicrobiales bacterium]
MASGMLNSGSPTHYGFGLFLSSYRGQRTIRGSGSVQYRAQVTWFPDADSSVNHLTISAR